MATENSNTLKLKTYTSTRKNHLYFSNPAKFQYFRCNISWEKCKLKIETFTDVSTTGGVEKIIYQRRYDYLEKNKLLNAYKSGFRSLHSTMTALLETTDNSSMNIDGGLLNVVVYIDLKKAFDTIDHATLLRKLANYGLDLGSLRFFASYLGNRSQKCYTEEKITDSQFWIF